MDHLQKLQELLRIERDEDMRQYREKVQKRSLAERVNRGISWYPLEIGQSYLGTGGRLVIELRREHTNAPNALSAGNIISLFGILSQTEAGRAQGVITHITKKKMKVVLGGKHHIPYWLHHSNLGVDLEFDNKSYAEMELALKTVDQAENNRLSSLREILLSKAEASFNKWDYRYTHPALNSSQTQAVQQILEAKDVALIHGPPGTGKTTTLVQAIKECAQREHQVLVCAPSNTAVDLLTVRAAEEGLKVLRLGNPARIDENIHVHTLDESIIRHPDYAALKKLRKETEALYRQANKFKRNFGREEAEKRRALNKEARDFKTYAQTLESYILKQVLDAANVVTCTLVGAAHKLLKDRKFHTLFIDEAAQALEPACWIPITKVDRVILAGDHHQLPPTVKSMEAGRGGLAKTLFEGIISRKPQAATLLQTQYRMHEHIMRFSARQFYNDQLTADKEVAWRSLGAEYDALEFIDTAGCSFDEKKDGSLSTFNPDEADLLLRHLARLLVKISSENSEILNEYFSIGIISPYKAQIKILKKQLEESPMLEEWMQYIRVRTVDGFQGQECDVIYISLARSNAKGEIGFLKDIRRMNVAMTRARKKLVLVGDSSTLAKNNFYKAFLDYVDEVGAYRSAWELL